MAWIESHQELYRHPKTKRLARLLNTSIPAAIGHLHLLWWWALDYAQDGQLAQYGAEDIADAVIWEGDLDVLLPSLNEAGFLDLIDGVYSIHDWDEYAGRLLDKRKQNTERKRKSRGSHVVVTQDNQGSHGATVPNTTQPNSTVPNQHNQPKKRRDKSALTVKQQAGFDRFWDAYPKQLAIGDAEKAWAKVNPDDTLLEAIIMAVDKARDSPKWNEDGGQYIPHPATWLNRKQWLDKHTEKIQQHIPLGFSSLDEWATGKGDP